MKTSTTLLTAGALKLTMASAAAAGCFGMEREPGLSEITNVQLAGLTAMELHGRNSTYDNLRRYRTNDFNLSNGETVEVEGSFSGHSYQAAVRICQDYHGETTAYSRGLFGSAPTTATSITADFSALTCDGDEAYVIAPSGQVYVVPSRGTPTAISGPQQCVR